MKTIFQIVFKNWKTTLAALSALFVFSLTVGIGGAYLVGWTGKEEFCISCHNMTYNYNEYKGTIHDTNRTGVRATCSNCHTPHEPGPLMFAKLKGSKDIFYTFVWPTIYTKEKFEAKRAEMAHTVWKGMMESDSATCRSCHVADKMSPELQSVKAQARHAKAKTEGKTCIECHFAIAHKEPEGPGPTELFKKPETK